MDLPTYLHTETPKYTRVHIQDPRRSNQEGHHIQKFLISEFIWLYNLIGYLVDNLAPQQPSIL